MLASVENKFGHVDVPVNNAGTMLVGPMEHMPFYNAYNASAFRKVAFDL